MSEIIKHSEIVECSDWSLFFERVAVPGSGFALECDNKGNVRKDREERARKLLADPAFRAPVIHEHRWHYRAPAILRCDCGTKVELGRHTNTCEKCGRDYNSGGQELAPREQWGEETGEHWTECL